MSMLWVTDLDETVVPQLDNPDRAEGPDLIGLKDYLNSHFIPAGGIVAISTGRHRAMSEADMLINGENRLPARFAIYNVGTEIYEHKGGTWQLLQEYEDHLKESGFDADSIYAVFNTAAHDMPDLDLRPQEPERNSPLKASFYANQSMTPAKMYEKLAPYLAGHDTQLILSTHNDHTTFIDVLPARAGKGMAMRFLARHLLKMGTQFQAAAFSGDSGNDILGFDPARFRAETGLPLYGIVPGNAKPELLDHTAALASQGHTVFHSSHHRAGGVLEGLRFCRAHMNRQPAPNC